MDFRRSMGSGRVGGFTLIEAAVFLFIFSIISLTFYQAWSLGTRHIMNSKYRLGATAIATQQMEIIRSLIFDDIGTTSGIPVGTLAQDQTITANSNTYQVHTVVQFVDDATDGTAGAGTDMAPNDYKKVTLTVSWGGASASEQVGMTSIFSLDGVESVAAGTGILSVNILNGAGIGVANASVHIVNASVVPAVNLTANTDANGNLTFPGAPASVQGYQISVSKSGYYSNMTYAPYPTSAFNPVNTHASIVAGSLTAATIVDDERSNIDLRSKDPFDADILDIDFSISGGLMIGTDPATSAPVYDFAQTSATNGSGEFLLSDRSAGVYALTLDPGESGFEYLRLDPEETEFGTVNLIPGTTETVKLVLADKALSSALIAAKNGADSSPIAGASVRLSNTALGYDTTITADTYGQAYFPTSNVPLVAGTYDIEVSASGFTTATDTIVITGAALIKKTVPLSL